VIGFALPWDGQEHGVFWISGDTVLYDGVRQIADRLRVDVALLHLGGVQFPVTGPVRYTMTGATPSSCRRAAGRRGALSLAADRRGGRAGRMNRRRGPSTR
jgi:hypothetical protein